MSFRLLTRKKVRGCIYARYSTRFQHSIQDQVRACREWAKAHDIDIDDVHIYSDAGKTGKSRRRVGLQAMLDAIKRKEVAVVLTFATNRLHRKMHVALQFVEEEIIENRLRCVFVAQNIDTADQKFWKALIYVFAMIDELGVQMTSRHIREAHIGLLRRGLISGTLAFGYASQVAEGGGLTRRGRPQRVWAIDPQQAQWVKQIFDWYVKARLDFSEIARRLRAAKVPSPPKVDRWTRNAVRRVLKNRRYIGDWSYGRSESVWQSKADYSRQFEKATPTYEYFKEELRITEDALFLQAQERMLAKENCGGRPSHTGERIRDVILELAYCPEHKRYLSAFGTGTKYAACHDCKREGNEQPAIYSLLNRKKARKQLFDVLARHLQLDDDLVNQAISCAAKQIEHQLKPDPAELDLLNRSKQQLGSQINFILENPGETETDHAENSRQLSVLRSKRAQVERQIAEHKAGSSVAAAVPTAEELRGIASDWGALLSRAASSESEEDRDNAMAIAIAMTGGRIDCSQQGESKSHGGWVQGSFQLRLIGALLRRPQEAAPTEEAPPIVIDFKRLSSAEALADEVKSLWDQDLEIHEITDRLSQSHDRKMGRAMVTKAIKYWHQLRGLPTPDGRQRRKTLGKENKPPTIADQICDRVWELCEQGRLLEEIATELKVERGQVTAALQLARQRRGLPPLDGRARRRSLHVKSRPNPL